MSIRSDILTKSPFLDLVAEKFQNFETDPDALAYAVEGHFRSIPKLSAIDGFNTFHVMEETVTTLRVVGMAYFLPSSLIPLDASFRMTNGNISYRVQLGTEDDAWKGLTEKKRWSAVYLYATEEYKPQWNWDPPLEGPLLH